MSCNQFYRKVLFSSFNHIWYEITLISKLDSFLSQKKVMKWKLREGRALLFSNLWHRCSTVNFLFLFSYFPLFLFSYTRFQLTNVAKEWSPTGFLVWRLLNFEYTPLRRHTNASKLEAPDPGVSTFSKIVCQNIIICVFFWEDDWLMSFIIFSNDFQMILWPGKRDRTWI